MPNIEVSTYDERTGISNRADTYPLPSVGDGRVRYLIVGESEQTVYKSADDFQKGWGSPTLRWSAIHDDEEMVSGSRKPPAGYRVTRTGLALRVSAPFATKLAVTIWSCEQINLQSGVSRSCYGKILNIRI